MTRSTWLFRPIFLAGLVISMVATTMAQQPTDIGNALGRAYQHYLKAEFGEGEAIASTLLERADITARDSIAILECLAVCTYGQGAQFRDSAFQFLQRMADIGPCLNRLPQEFWPRQLCDVWYGVKQAHDVLVCPTGDSARMQTIAFLPFDNHSLGDYHTSLSGLGNTLSEFMMYHFSLVGDLEVVERTKLDYLLDEIHLTEDSLVDINTAIRIGRLLGCHLMVFGSVTQFDRSHTRLMARVVHVETGKIMAVVIKEGKPDYSKLEKELVEELAEQLEIKLENETKDRIKQSGTDSENALFFYSRGLEAMDHYDYHEAYQQFKKAYELDNSFVEAKRKMEYYWPLVG